MRRSVALLLACWLGTFALFGCESCSCGERPLAEVERMHGHLGVARAASATHFTGASVGTDFWLGDAARTGSDGTSALRLDDGNGLSMRPSTTVRFSATRPGARGRRIDLLAGEATLTLAHDTELDTGAGTVTARAGTELRLRRQNGALELMVVVGQARLEEDGTEPIDLVIGTPMLLDYDVHPHANEHADPAAAAAAIEPAPPIPTETLPEEGANLRANRTDFVLAAGEGLVLRDPAPPTAIGIETARSCPHGALVQIYDGSRLLGSARGTGTIPIAFQEGALGYRVHCIEGGAVASAVAAEGRVRVLRSTGQAPLPRSAPTSNVEADGRTYQILYSHRLPSVSLRWPNGPSGSGTLVVGGRRIAVSGPRHRFESGTLSEGTHRVHFESGGRQSRETTIAIRFDPVAAAASLESPLDGSFEPGARVRVSGMALPGNLVFAAGQPIAVGPDQRFSGEVVAPSSGALVIRLVRGDQASVFLRRPRGATP